MASDTFFRSDFDFIIGCDPGPEHCAFAVIEACGSRPRLESVGYVPNGAVHGIDWASLEQRWSPYFTSPLSFGTEDRVAFVFEKCANQGSTPGALTFETCMMGGELRHVFATWGADALHAFTPSDWRYIVTGKGGANDANIRNILLDIFPEHDKLVRSYSTKAKRTLNLRKPVTSHLRDAIGVALAAGLVEYRKGIELGRFPAYWGGHCG